MLTCINQEASIYEHIDMGALQSLYVINKVLDLNLLVNTCSTTNVGTFFKSR